MTKFSAREKIIFSLCVVLALVFAIYRGLYQPLHRTDQQIDSRTFSAHAQLADASRIIARTQSLSKYDSSFLQGFKQTSSDEKVLSGMLSDIEGLAGEDHIIIADIKSRKRKTDDYNTFTLSLTMEGSMLNLLHFIYILQQPPLWYAVDEMDIRPHQGQLHCRLVVTKSLVP